uniref:3-oxoacyl-[acyl-carrier-protein] reductase n=1 Tax=Brassica oleracea var. oleracea TaxID=109376 RepID=A0A0D3C545_BRAOL
MEETYLEDTCWQITFSFLSFVLCLSLAHNLRPEKSRKKRQRSQPAAGRKSSNPSSLPPPSPINAGESVVAGTTGKAKKKAGGARDLRILSPVLWSAIRAQSSNCVDEVGAMADLKDKVVLVTGASSGIGKEICLDLVKAGCKIIAAARRVDRLNSLCSNINSFGSTGTQATALELDVASVQPPFEKRLRKLGKYLAYLQSDVGLIITLVHCETLFYLKKLARNLIGFVTSRFYYGHITIICFLK